MTIPQAFETARQHHEAGRLREAEAMYRQVLAVEPRHADALQLLGVVAHQMGRDEVAMDLIRRAIALAPAVPAFHSNLGEVYRKLGRIEEAIAAQRRAIQLQPDYAEAHSNLGAALCDQGRFEEAATAQRRALQLQPNCAAAHSNLGVALWNQGRLDEAIAAYRRAIECQPRYTEAHSNLGNALRDQGRFDEAIAVQQRAIQLQPDCTEAQWNLSLLLLQQGDFTRGWPMFESRWTMEKGAPRNFAQPMWQGEALAGRRVLLHAEQGLGDTLQFVRYAPLVAQRGGEVIVECQPGLKTLLRSLEGVTQVVEQGEPLPAFDLHCPLMSLPLAFGTQLETIPAPIPYLRADPQKVAHWRERLEQETYPATAADLAASLDPLVPSAPSPRPPLKVGLVWAGGERPQQPKLRPLNQRRSMRLSQFAPLAAVPGVSFVSLQKGAPAAETKTPPAGMRLVDWTGELKDFADTAALLANLDLVISVDTAVAHLAGALGQPIWLLNRFDTCWRWLTDREDSPWYPTLRLFRQPHFLDWEPVLTRVCEQLTLLAANPARKQ